MTGAIHDSTVVLAVNAGIAVRLNHANVQLVSNHVDRVGSGPGIILVGGESCGLKDNRVRGALLDGIRLEP